MAQNKRCPNSDTARVTKERHVSLSQTTVKNKTKKKKQISRYY